MKIPIQQLLMRTEVDQVEINQRCFEAELYKMKLLASQQSQQLQVAKFVGAATYAKKKCGGNLT